MLLNSISFSAKRSLFIWWLELDITPVTIDGPTAGNIEFSHKSYNPVDVVPIDPNSADALLVEPPAKFLDGRLTVLLIEPLIKLCMVLT
ncbi:MAG: hypothetical protein QMC06_02485 [Gammaproteobacteria bacterium]